MTSRSSALLRTPPEDPNGESQLDRFLAELPRETRQRFRRSVTSARELASDAQRAEEPWQRVDVVPTTVTGLDALLGGGLLRGEMVELIGRRTCGRFALNLATLASATRLGEGAVLVDLGDHFDPHTAAPIGIDLERLLWLRPTHLKKALHATEVALQAGFPLVVLDLGLPPVPGGRGVEASWLRLQRAASQHDCALLVSSPYRVTGTAVQTVLELQRPRGRWLRGGPQLLHGMTNRIALEKARGRLQIRKSRSSRTPNHDTPIDLSLLPDTLAQPIKL